MSWFEYGKLELKHRRLRKGVWLRVRCLSDNILKDWKSKRRSKFELLDWVVVSEIRPEGKVLLEMWSHIPVVDMMADKSIRYTVTYTLVDEDPEWVCEGDMGRGYKEPKKG